MLKLARAFFIEAARSINLNQRRTRHELLRIIVNGDPAHVMKLLAIEICPNFAMPLKFVGIDDVRRNPFDSRGKRI